MLGKFKADKTNSREKGSIRTSAKWRKGTSKCASPADSFDEKVNKPHRILLFKLLFERSLKMATAMKIIPLSLTYLSALRHLIPSKQLCSRQFSLTACHGIKRIEVTSQDKVTIIEGKPVEADKRTNVRTIKAPTKCPLCEFQDKLTYRDVLILQQFLSPDGRILPRHVTGVCFTMQWKLQNILYQSYSAGLLPKYKPILPVNENPLTYDKNYKWRKNNVYYEDFSIENPM
ncbi:28S ribosomal protein S18a, mitochondrial [Bulinus truncatus]|nr:28S ribosomal protein S18a, mitochondrial [Bulinus truncatus]